MDISPEIKRAIIEQKLSGWQNTLYALGLDYKIYKRINDSAAMERITGELNRCEIAVGILLEEMNSLGS